MRRSRAQLGLTTVAWAGTVAVAAVFAAMALRHRSIDVQFHLFLFQNGPSAVVLLWMGRLVLSRRPGNTAGRVLIGIGIVQTLHALVALVADVQLVAAGWTAPLAGEFVNADLPLTAAIPLWVMGWLWVPAPVLAVTILPLAFPDGEFDGRWRPVVVTAAAGGLVFMVGAGIDAWPTATWAAAATPASVTIPLGVGGLLVAVAAVGGVTALLHRWRRSAAARRRPFQVAGAAVVAFAVVAVASYPWQQVWVPAILVSFNLLIVGYALAAARYRLHDLEPVLGKAAAVGVGALLVAAAYALAVVGAAQLAGPPPAGVLPALVAVAAAALLIEPARHAAHRWVNRVLFRRQADRLEVMSRLAASANAGPATDVMAEVSELLARSTGATRAQVRLDQAPEPAAFVDVGEAPVLQTTVEHQGERFGEVQLYATARADLAPDAAQLLADVAHTLGVVLANDRLARELATQLEELRASRQRLVEAHDQARRGLERDIHDGAQSRLIALRLRLTTLRERLARQDANNGQLLTELDQIGNDVDTTIRSLRTLARGLHPPILEQAGLTDALRAHARDLPVPLDVTGEDLGRFPRSVEAAAYFACLEAIQNAVRHSGATAITVRLARNESTLTFSVADDGTGFDPTRTRAGTGLQNIDDRLSALGGAARIHSRHRRGTSVVGTIPFSQTDRAVAHLDAGSRRGGVDEH